MAANKKSIVGTSDKKKPSKKSSGVPSSNISSSKILTARPARAPQYP